MDLFNGLTDDQTALIGCVVALLVSGTMMSLSYYVGRMFQASNETPEPTEPHTLRMPDPAALRAQQLHKSQTEDRTIRRAA